MTPLGLDLAPTLVEIVLGAARYEETDAPPGMVRRMRRDRARFIAGVKERSAIV